MKSILNKVTSTAMAAIVLIIGGIMAGMGLAVMAVLAVFALAIIGLAMIAAPFMRMPERDAYDLDGVVAEENVKAS